MPPTTDDPSEFARPTDMVTKAGGPREFARLTEGSFQPGGASQITAPEPSN
jgi:hypothetical protein